MYSYSRYGRGRHHFRPHRSPLKNIGGSENGKLYIDSPGTNTIWPVRQRLLERNMPNLYNFMRDSGQRIVNPLDYLPCESYEDYKTNQIVLDLLMNRIVRPDRASLWGPSSPTGGQDFVGFLYQAYFETYQAQLSGDGYSLEEAVEKALIMFRGASEILRIDRGCGWGPQLYRTIVAMALLFVPLLAELDIECVFDLILSIYTMTDKREMTLRRLIAALSPQHQYSLRILACQNLLDQPSFLGQNILAIFNGRPLDYPEY